MVYLTYGNESDSISVREVIESRSVTRKQLGLIALSAMASLVDGFDLALLALVVPDIASEFGIRVGDLGIALSASMIGVALGCFLLAPFGDKYGRRRLIIIGLLTVCLSSILATVCTMLWQLVVVRLLTGLGVGMIVPNNYALISDLLPERVRVRSIAVIVGAFAIGGLVAGSVATEIISFGGGWRSLFVAGALFALLISSAVYLLLPESFSILAARGDLAGLTAVLRRLDIAAPKSFVGDPIARSGPGVLSHTLKILLSEQYRFRSLFVVLCWASSSMSYYMITGWLPSLLSLLGWKAAEARQFGSFVWIGGILGGFLLGWLVDRARNKAVVIVTSLAAAAVAVLLFALLPVSRAGGVVLIVCIGLGIGGVQDTLTGIMTLFFPSQIRASALGCTNAVARIGAAMGPAVGGFLLNGGASPADVLLFLILPMSATSLFIVLLFRLGVPVTPLEAAPSRVAGPEAQTSADLIAKA